MAAIEAPAEKQGEYDSSRYTPCDAPVTPRQYPSARPREVLGNEMQCAHELAERSREASSQGSQNLPIHCPGGRLIMH